MAVRAAVLKSKAEIEAVLVNKEDETSITQADYLETVALASNCEGVGSDDVTGEAATLLGQVEKTRAGDMASLLELMEQQD